MPKIRGYSSYRGRSPLWKLIIAVLLFAVILASFGILLLQRNIIYDETGTPRIEFSWEREEAEGDEPEVPPLDIGEPEPDSQTETAGEAAAEETPPEPPAETTGRNWEALRVYAVQAAPLSPPIFWDMAAIVRESGGNYNAFSTLLKDEEGWVYFPCSATLDNSVNMRDNTTEALHLIDEQPLHAIGRITCFHDSRRAQWDDSTRLRNTGGYIFYDGNDTNWMDPAKPAAVNYLCALAASAAEHGFDEILLTDVGYPTEGKLDKIAYGETPLQDNLTAFLSTMRGTLQNYNVKLSIELPKSVLLEGGADVSGISLAVAAPWVDRIYAKVEAEEIEPCARAVEAVREGEVEFIPELTRLPENLPARYMHIPF